MTPAQRRRTARQISDMMGMPVKRKASAKKKQTAAKKKGK